MIRTTAVGLVAMLAITAFVTLPVATFGTQREDVKEMVKLLQEDTTRFRKSLEASLDNSSLNGTEEEDEANNYVDKFRDATKRLKQRYDDNKYATGDANEVLTRAKRIEGWMHNHTPSIDAQKDWQTVRSDLELIARTYNITLKW